MYSEPEDFCCNNWYSPVSRSTMTAHFAIAVLFGILIIPARSLATTSPGTNKTCRQTAQRLDTYIIQAKTANHRELVDDDEDIDEIVGGFTAKFGNYPFQAAILKDGLQFCGGTLIDSMHILTAAHCVDVFEPEDLSTMTVYLNTITLKPDSDAVVRGIQRILYPKYYNSESHESDVALLTLQSAVTGIKPVALPINSVTQSYAGQVAKVIGWGTTSFQGASSSDLMETDVNIVSNQKCGQMYGKTMNDVFLCAAAPGKDSCQGDSGGPLLIRGFQLTQVGVVSWGFGCANPDFPGVYTRVSKVLPWINAIRTVC